MTSETQPAQVVSVPAADSQFEAGEAGGRVIRGGTLRAAGALAGVLAGAVSAPLVVRHLGATSFGHYLTVTSIIFIVTALTEGGLANVAVRQYSVGDTGQRRSLIANLTGLRLALGVLGAALAIGFGALAGYPHVIVVGLVLGSVGYVLAGVQGSYSVALNGTLRLSALAGIDMLRSLSTSLLLIALVLGGSELTGFYTVTVVVQALALVVTAMLVRHDVPLMPAFDRASWRELARETALYALAATIGVIYFQVALITMSLLDPGPQTGFYAIAFRIVEIVNGIPWLLAGSVLPVLALAAANDRERLRFVAGRVFEGAVVAGGWVAVVLIVGARFGIDIVAGAKGHPSIAVLRIMGVGVTATFIVSSWGFVLLSLRQYRQLVMANLGALVLAIALSLVLIPALHARGGAITTAVLELVLAGSYMAFLSRHEIFAPKRFVACFALAIALGMGVGLLALSINAVFAVLVASVVYFGALWLLGAIPSELIDALPWRK
ncbi:MAG TPA: oligosaccharide flippase family protein [Solirubrobacteraceae bacterium]|nr:oligosaccharide flippase family protein [Solirubrobacteraceae bacterium]